jgi:ribosome maturation protein Sdo1
VRRSCRDSSASTGSITWVWAASAMRRLREQIADAAQTHVIDPVEAELSRQERLTEALEPGRLHAETVVAAARQLTQAIRPGL